MLRRAVLVVLSLLIPSLGPAAAEPWTRIGLDAGVVSTLASAPSNPSTVYAGLGVGGIFRSLDGGVTWSFAATGLDLNDTVRALAVDARRPDTVWAATFHGIFRSVNGGVSWDSVLVAGAASLAQDPVSGVLYAGLQSGPIIASRTGGSSWQTLSRSSPENVGQLVFDPRDHLTLYAASASGLFKSTNGGAKWFRSDRGLPSYPILAVALAPGSSRRLYAATAGVPGQVVFRSDDGGARWSAVDGGALVGFISSLTVQPGKQDTVWAVAGGHVFRSLDRGLTWSLAEEGLAPNTVVTVLPGASTLLAATVSGVFRSGDQGTSWGLSSRGLQAATISGLALDRLRPNRLWAAAFSSGVFRTATGGASWGRLSSVPAGATGPFAGPLAADPNRPGTAYVGLLEGIAHTGDAGSHWSGSPLPCLVPQRIAVDPLDSSTVYATGLFSDPDCGNQPDACAMFRSSDAGQSWTCIRNGLPEADFLVPDPLQASRVLALVGGRDIYTSADRGGSWSLLATGVNTGFLVPDPHRPGTIWGGNSQAGILRSDDGGRTWTPTGTGIPPFTLLTTVALDPVDPDVLYAGSLVRGVFKSTDGGLTWAPLGTGLEGINVRFLEIDPQNPGTVYAGTDEAGVMRLRQ